MTPHEQIVIKRALEVLDPLVAGLPPDALFDQVERALGETITTLERAKAQKLMLDKEWAQTYRNPMTNRVYIQIVTTGRMAMIAL